MTNFLTLCSLICFQCCAWPTLLRMYQRGTSADLSIWREVILLIGVGSQVAVMWRTDAAWQVLLSPLLSAINVGLVLAAIRYFRVDRR